MWSIGSDVTASPHTVDDSDAPVVSMMKKSYRFHLSDDAIIYCSRASKGCSNDAPLIDEEAPFHYLAGAVVNISDVADLDLRLVRGEGSGGDGDDGSYVSVVVVGEGFQLLRID